MTPPRPASNRADASASARRSRPVPVASDSDRAVARPDAGRTTVGTRTIRIGPRLRALRTARNLTLEQVAQSAGVTKGFISRLERDHASVSVATLQRICDVLQTPMGALFDYPEKAVVAAQDAPVIDFGTGGLRLLVLTPANVNNLRMVKMLLAPGADVDGDAHFATRGSIFVHVLHGKLSVELDGETVQLEPGDSLTFPGRTPHSYRNASRRERCEALVGAAPAD
jgi:transcriptional regulator with XRE-family HTH domain